MFEFYDNFSSPFPDSILGYKACLEALAGRYIYEAHHQFLDGLDICEHDAGIFLKLSSSSAASSRSLN